MTFDPEVEQLTRVAWRLEVNSCTVYRLASLRKSNYRRHRHGCAHERKFAHQSEGSGHPGTYFS